MPLPLAIPIVITILLGVGVGVEKVRRRRAEADEISHEPDPEELHKRRHRDRVRKSFKQDRARILDVLSEKHQLGLKPETIAALPLKGVHHRELIGKAIERKAKRLREPKSERETGKVMSELLAEAQQLQACVKAQMLAHTTESTNE